MGRFSTGARPPGYTACGVRCQPELPRSAGRSRYFMHARIGQVIDRAPGLLGEAPNSPQSTVANSGERLGVPDGLAGPKASRN